MLVKNQIYEAEITDYTAEGQGVAHIEGCAVFIPNAVAGEKVRVRVEKAQKTWAAGKIVEILEKSPHRVNRECEVAKLCGGCDFWHMDYAEETRLKAQRVKNCLNRIGGENLAEVPILAAPDCHGYRNKAQYPVAVKKGRAYAGFYRAGTHDVVENARCRILPEEIDAAKDAVIDYVNQYRVSVYDETTGKGLLRHIYVRRGAVSGQILVCLAVNGEKIPRPEALVQRLNGIPGFTTLVLSGLAIADAQEKQAEEVRGTTGASFTVERDISTGGWNGNYSTQEFMSEDMIQQIAAVDGIAGYDATLITLPRIFNDKGEELAHENYSFYNYGSYNSQYHELFLSGRFELVEGTHITDDMTNSIIISRELAEWNGLKVGDTLAGVYYPQNNTPEVDMEIVGIFDVVADKGDQVNMYDDASYYAYSSYVFCSMDAAEGLIKGWGEDGEGISEAYYYVTDAAQLENVIREVQSISSINWNNYKITANDEVYQNISSALSDTGTLITTLIVVITAVSMVLIILILSMSIRSRKRETGILLAVGIAKPAVILQYVLETLLIAVVAFPLAYLSSKQVAGTLGTLFGKAAENVIVTPEHFMLVAIVGGVLLVAAVLVSSISTMRLKPKQILSQME